MHRHSALTFSVIAAALCSVIGCGKDTTAPGTPSLSMSPTGSLTTPRDLHTATLLNNGKVLVAGGVGPTTFPLVAELFDPASGTFTATGSLGAVRHSATATLLKNGKVLVAGGKGAPGTPTASAQLFDPVTGTFMPTGNMTTPRVF